MAKDGLFYKSNSHFLLSQLIYRGLPIPSLTYNINRLAYMGTPGVGGIDVCGEWRTIMFGVYEAGILFIEETHLFS